MFFPSLAHENLENLLVNALLSLRRIDHVD
jgi:hypothetical protein